MSFNNLTFKEEQIILYKKTELPFSGEYDNFFKKGTYICKRCNNRLFSSQAKFNAQCGWPAFDAGFKNAILQIPDSDGYRTEIICSNCKGHLGHVFKDEGFTPKNTRHCVNSLSIKFIPAKQELPEVFYE